MKKIVRIGWSSRWKRTWCKIEHQFALLSWCCFSCDKRHNSDVANVERTEVERGRTLISKHVFGVNGKLNSKRSQRIQLTAMKVCLGVNPNLCERGLSLFHYVQLTFSRPHTNATHQLLLTVTSHQTTTTSTESGIAKFGHLGRVMKQRGEKQVSFLFCIDYSRYSYLDAHQENAVGFW